MMSAVSIGSWKAVRWQTLLGAMLAILAGVLTTGVTAASAQFGMADFEASFVDPSGGVFSQAGGHPYESITTFDWNTHAEAGSSLSYTDGTPKDVSVALPQGFTGNPGALPRCTSAQLDSEPVACPIASQVGVALVHFAGIIKFPFPLYNMQTPAGVPGRIAMNIAGVVVGIDATVRSGGDYGLTLESSDISQALPVTGITIVTWGVPADPRHDGDRCRQPFEPATPFCAGEPNTASGPNPAGLPPSAFLTLPTGCTAPGAGLGFDLHTDSWEQPGVFVQQSFTTHAPPGSPLPPEQWGAPVGVTGCESVPFAPSVDVRPTASAPDAPTGLGVSVAIPTEGLESPTGVAQAALRKMVVRLPEGMTLNPAAAGGLTACTPAQIELHSGSSSHCPEESKIGSVEVKTPLLAETLEGGLYLASQNDNPFGSLLAAYLVAEAHGVVVKQAGHLEADPLTGRLTATFDGIPQQPISSVKLDVFGGQRAPLIAPSSCGSAAVESTLEGWNGETVTHSDPYAVSCTPGLGAFSPSFVAGTTSNQAGAYSPFALSVARQDGEQTVSGLQQTLAPGLLAKLAGVPLCADGDAAAGACSAASQIGTVTVGSGAGPSPYFLSGKIFLTGPYNGGPFGEVVVIHAAAGPFDLGNVVVRGSIRIDPHTAQATVVSDPFPQILQGIPVALRRVDVSLDRPGFTFNSTDCEPLSIPATITSAQGTAANVSSRYQAANCAALPFHPSFTATTQGNGALSGNGASLVVKIASKSGPDAKAGEEEANIRQVDVQLPLALPARLSTLQKACTAAQFAANPAGCPAASNVGTVVAGTPILSAPLTGPAYLVSHGGAAYPDLVVVLQGDGVTIDAVGTTSIKKGITYSRFDTVPDAPLSSFELRLPEGKYSALAANKNLCAPTKTVTVRKRVTRKVHGRKVRSIRQVRQTVTEPLAMPTTITGQNGAVLTQTTKIAVTGCAKRASATKPGKGKKK